jgi:molecular chaperone HtpG
MSKEKHHFQAEIEQVLNIVINSLYTDKEIFVRELVSNAADALEKLRFLQTSGQAIQQPDLELKISVTTDETAKTITIADSGIGMTNTELVENLGTIAHSGSRAFLKRLGEDKKADASLIGQFGVGFYSAFMVAGSVTVQTRSSRPDEPGWTWVSTGAGGYEIEAAADLPRGTKVVLQLKEDAAEFAKDFTLERIIKKYSSFVPFPIELNGKTLNTVRALWARNKNEIKEEEYNEFYKYIGHDQEPATYRLHFSADAPLAIQALLFLPSKNWESMGLSRTEPEVNLYCRKVLIQAKSKDLFPEWLRFLKGVVDSEDLPLNISRESMQDTSLMAKLNKVLTSRFIKFLDEQANKDATLYQTFYATYNRFLKEGVVSDFTHRADLAKLLRFETSALSAGQLTSLADYVKRMPADQKDIYYLLAPRREAAEASPYYEVFQSRKYEVLFLSDPWDDFVMDHLREFDSKNLRSAEKADLNLGDDQAKAAEALSASEAEALAKWMKEVLGTKVSDVKVSQRLVGSPTVVTDPDQFMTASMRKLMKNMHQEKQPAATQVLEINTRHGLIHKLNQMRQTDAALAAKVAGQMLDNAQVAAGLLEDPRDMIQRLNELLEQLMVK